jgi:hypothetical protein
MGAVDPHVRNALDELSPPRLPPDRWDEILEAAGRRPHARRRWLVGAVLHVVIQSGWGGTQIDLATGARTQVHGEDELWYDAQRGIHQLSRFAGVVQSDSLYPSGRVPYLDKTLASLGTSYRKALDDGTARVLGSDVIDGEPIYWIRVDTQMLPDTADGRLHEWAHDVAISKESFRPVATRETRDGRPGPDGISIVESVDTLPAGEGDFTARPSSTNGVAMRFNRKGSLTAAEATAVLGRPALWAGRSVAGVALARISRDERSEGFDRQRGTWARTYTGVTFFYGAAEGGGIGIPPPSVPYVQIAESRTLDDGFQRGVRHYSPPAGSILVFGDHIAVMQENGLHLALESSSEELLLAAARALEPVPGS